MPPVPADLAGRIERAAREELYTRLRAYCLTSATARAERLLVQRPGIAYVPGADIDRVLAEAAELGPEASRLAEYRLALLTAARELGIEKAFQEGVYPKTADTPDTDAALNEHIRALLSQVVDFTWPELGAFLAEHPFFVSASWEMRFTSYAKQSAEDGHPNVSRYYDSLRYTVRRCRRAGLEAGLTHARIVEYIIAHPESMDELNMNDESALKELMDVVGDFSAPEVSHEELTVMLMNHPELLSDDALQLVEVINAYADTTVVRHFAGLAYATLDIARRHGVAPAVMATRLSQVLSEPDETAADVLAQAYIATYGEELHPELLDLTYAPEAFAARAERRLRRLSRNAQSEMARLNEVLREFCLEKSWEAVTEWLIDYPLLRAPIARAALRTLVEEWLDSGPLRPRGLEGVDPYDIAAVGIERLRLLAEVEEMGVAAAVMEAGKRMSRWIATKEHGQNLLVIDRDFAEAHDLPRNEVMESFASAMWAGALNALTEFRHTGDASVLSSGLWATDRAVESLRESSSRDDAEQLAPVLNTRAALLRSRFVALGELADLNDAIDNLDNARGLSHPGADRRQIARNLVDTLLQRHNADRDHQWLQRAKAIIGEERLVDEAELQGADERAQGRYVLGRVLFEQCRDAPSASLFDECVATFEQAVAEPVVSDDTRVLALSGLANALVLRFEGRGDRSDLTRAIEIRQRTNADYLDVRRESSILLDQGDPISRLSLANVLLAEASLDDAPTIEVEGLLEEAIAAAQDAPELRSSAATRLAQLTSRRGEWKAAAAAYSVAISSIQDIVRAQALSSPGKGHTAILASLAASSAYAHARAGLARAAATTLDNARALAFASRLERRLIGTDLASAPTKLSRPIVYLTAAEEGGVGLMVSDTEPMSDPRIVWLPGLRNDDLLVHTENFLDAIKTPTLATQLRIEEVTAWLWDAVMGPLVSAFGDEASITAIPCGLLNLLPLHAAWTEDPTTTTGRRYVIDQLQLTYGVNHRAQIAAESMASRAGVGGVLGVDEPLPVSASPLVGSATEITAAFLGPRPHIHLRNERATREAILSALASARIAHFSCHGESDVVDPSRSHLLCADDERLTLADLLGKDLTGLRLAVLSACESGMVGGAMIDEVVGLFSGLLQAGAAGVIGSLWKVPGGSTAETMMRFYEAIFEEGEEPPAALRSAIRTVRDATAGEKREYLSGKLEPEMVIDPLAPDEALPHARPYYWAGFSFFGA